MDLALTNTPAPASSPRPRRFEAAVPLALMALSAIPTLAGVYRLTLLAQGRAPTADDVRLAAHPVAIALHVLGATAFCTVGALQFWPPVLRVRPWLHRALGWCLAPLGILGALSGIWLALFPTQHRSSSFAVVAMRVVVGVLMSSFLALGVRAAVRRKLRAHREWMVRAYALGSAAGTQSLVLAPLTLILGYDSAWSFALGMGAGWALNAAVAEALLRRGPRRRV